MGHREPGKLHQIWIEEGRSFLLLLPVGEGVAPPLHFPSLSPQPGPTFSPFSEKRWGGLGRAPPNALRLPVFCREGLKQGPELWIPAQGQEGILGGLGGREGGRS